MTCDHSADALQDELASAAVRVEKLREALADMIDLAISARTTNAIDLRALRIDDRVAVARNVLAAAWRDDP